jgi:5-methylthioadenosine/S-adenosylhomocysteine deaminase
MKRILIHCAAILTLDPEIGDLRGDILVEGSHIVAVAPSIRADDAEIISAERVIALPGFVDSHRHTWQSLLRDAAIDWTLAQYFSGIRGVMGRV